jgi:hypothetical protein
MKAVKEEKEVIPEDQDLSMETVMELQPDENGEIKLTQEQMEAMMAEQTQTNPYTHELNFDGIKSLEDVIEVLKSFKISIDPNQWEQNSKYIKNKND